MERSRRRELAGRTGATPRLELDRRRAGDVERAAALLGAGAAAALGGDGVLRFDACARRQRRPARTRCGALLARLDASGIDGALDARRRRRRAGAARPHAARRRSPSRGTPRSRRCRPTGATSLGEIELTSSDYLDRGGAPARADQPAAACRRLRAPLPLRARRFGYGASPEMVRRCLERCDDDGHPRQRCAILRALSTRSPVGTQGPVWYIGGRTV